MYVEAGVYGSSEAGVVLQPQQLGELQVHGAQLVHIHLQGVVGWLGAGLVVSWLCVWCNGSGVGWGRGVVGSSDVR